MSYEMYKLPAGGDWFLEFNAQGFAAAVDANDQLECVCAEDVLGRQVCRQDGQLWVFDTHSKQRWCISERMKRHQQIEVTVLLAPSWQKQVLNAALLEMPRQACRLFLEAASTYKQMGISTYQGQPSAWLYRQHKIWATCLRTLGLGEGHLLNGLHGNANGIAASSDEDEELFMPLPAMSTCGMFALFCKWATQMGSHVQRTCSRWQSPRLLALCFSAL